MVMLALLVFIGLLVLLSLRIPVAYALGGMGLIILFLMDGIDGFALVAPTLWSSIASYTLVVAPLYIFMGAVISHCGLGSRLYQAVGRILYFLPGSMAISTSVGCALIGAVCGSSVATAAAVGNMAVTEMRKLGYKMEFASATVAAAGTLAIIIPPSIPMIIYGIITETSIRDLFIGGVIPGVILTGLFATYQFWHVARNKPGNAADINNKGIILDHRKLSLRDALLALVDIAPLLGLIVVVFGSMYTGVAAITESAAVGAVGSLILAFAYRSVSWKKMKVILIECARNGSMVGLIVAGAMLFGYSLTASNMAPEITQAVINLGLPPWALFIFIMLLLLFLGCFMEVLSILVITMPLFVPIISNLGWNTVWFGVIVTINMEMALITPPVGLNLYVTQAVVDGLKLETVARGIIPYVILLSIGIAIFGLFPGVVLWLPGIKF